MTHTRPKRPESVGPNRKAVLLFGLILKYSKIAVAMHRTVTNNGVEKVNKNSKQHLFKFWGSAVTEVPVPFVK